MINTYHVEIIARDGTKSEYEIRERSKELAEYEARKVFGGKVRSVKATLYKTGMVSMAEGVLRI